AQAVVRSHSSVALRAQSSSRARWKPSLRQRTVLRTFSYLPVYGISPEVGEHDFDAFPPPDGRVSHCQSEVVFVHETPCPPDGAPWPVRVRGNGLGIGNADEDPAPSFGDQSHDRPGAGTAFRKPVANLGQPDRPAARAIAGP